MENKNEEIANRRKEFISRKLIMDDKYVKKVSPLPWCFDADGLPQPYGWQKGPAHPLLYAAHDDLENIARFPLDKMLFHSTQNNIANGYYTSEACSNYPRVLAVMEEILQEYVPMAELRDVFRHRIGLNKQQIDERIKMIDK